MVDVASSHHGLDLIVGEGDNDRLVLVGLLVEAQVKLGLEVSLELRAACVQHVRFTRVAGRVGGRHVVE